MANSAECHSWPGSAVRVASPGHAGVGEQARGHSPCSALPGYTAPCVGCGLDTCLPALSTVVTPVTARLIVRRVKDLNRGAAPGQGELFYAWRYHAVFTDPLFETLQAEEHHRDHARLQLARIAWGGRGAAAGSAHADALMADLETRSRTSSIDWPAKLPLGSPTFMASKGRVPWTRRPHTRRPVHCHSAGM